MSSKYEHPVVQYWQDKTTAKVFESAFVPGQEPSAEWKKQCREVRLFHHGESDCVFVVDATDEAAIANAWENMADEVDIGTYNYWLTIYNNPDL